MEFFCVTTKLGFNHSVKCVKIGIQPNSEMCQDLDKNLHPRWYTQIVNFCEEWHKQIDSINFLVNTRIGEKNKIFIHLVLSCDSQRISVFKIQEKIWYPQLFIGTSETRLVLLSFFFQLNLLIWVYLYLSLKNVPNTIVKCYVDDL